MARKKEWVVPMKQALPVLLVAVSIAAFMLNERMERRELLRALREATSDPFHGADMDRFSERLQVSLDGHTRAQHAPPIPLPTWRPR